MAIKSDEQDLVTQTNSISSSASEHNLSSAHELVTPEPEIGIQVKRVVKRFKVQ